MPRGVGAIVGGAFIGLVLAYFIRVSPLAGFVILLVGVALTFTFFLTRTHYLIFMWCFLTSFIWPIMTRLLPPEYYPIVGRAIFWGLLGCVIAAWAMDIILTRKQFISLENMALKGTILFFFLWCIMAMFTSLDVFNSIKKVSHIGIGLVVFYVFYDFFSRDRNNIKTLLTILFWIILFVASVTVVAGGYRFLSGMPVYKRISLWFWNPNSLGIMLFIPAPILIAAGFHMFANRGLKVLFQVVILAAILLSCSRASWLATAVSLSFLLWKTRAQTPILIAIVGLLMLGSFLFPVYGEDFYSFLAGEDFSGRKEIWAAGWNTACEYPLLGTGPGNYWKVMPQYIETPWLERADPHSMYLRNAAEMGFPAVFLQLACYAVFLWSSLRIEKGLKSEYLKWATRGAIASLLGQWVHGIFETGFLLTVFDAAEFSVLLPYMLMAIPFAARNVEQEMESG